MSYLTSRLPKDIALSVVIGLVTAFVGGFSTAWIAGWELAKEYPHDGQDGLGALMFGVYSAPLWGVLAFIVSFVARSVAYRKLHRLKDERDFNLERLAARESHEGQRPDNITA